MRGSRRLVLDTNVVLDCFGFADPDSRGIVAQLESATALLVANGALREELVRVLAYPALPFDEALRREVLRRYDHLARPVEQPRPGVALPRCRDPDDQKFLEAARDGHADFLITKDKALLELARGAAAAGFAIVTPAQYAGRDPPRTAQPPAP